MTVELDHLVVAARTLEQGVAWCEATLGVTPGPGGRHALMGTHNRLLKIGRAPRFPRAYLEIIAVDPEAARPGRPRWFGLDDPALQAAIAERPRLVHWVAGTRALDMQRWGLVASGFNPGQTLAVSRDTPTGRLRWRMVLRDDGALLAGGALPTLIEWDSVHPTGAMPDSGLLLSELVLRGLPPQAQAVLRPQGVVCAQGDGPALQALFETPCGPVTLESESIE
ncbi:MAG: VOC family protein [Pseudomonadota bacterium]